MCSGKVVSVDANKACSGKCKSGRCGALPRVWVVAACEGMVSLFVKEKSGAITNMLYGGYSVFPSLEQFKESIDRAKHTNEFDQLVIIGSGNDIAWIHSTLPETAARHIAAEIKYPLLSNWFKESAPMPHLSRVLTNVLAN